MLQERAQNKCRKAPWWVWERQKKENERSQMEGSKNQSLYQWIAGALWPYLDVWEHLSHFERGFRSCQHFSRRLNSHWTEEQERTRARRVDQKKSVLLWADGRDVSALLFPCSVVKTRKKRPGASSYARLACITGCCYNWGVHCGHANYFHRCCHWQHLRLWPHQILKKKKKAKAQPTELRPWGLSYEVAWRRDVFTVNWGFAAHCVALYLFMPSP